MKKISLIVFNLLFLLSCDQKRIYTPKVFDFNLNKPDIIADPSARTKDIQKQFDGNLKNSDRISFHRDNQCSINTQIVSLSKANFEASGTMIGLPNEGINEVYMKVFFNNGQVYCYKEPIRVYDRDTTAPLINPNPGTPVQYSLLTDNVSKSLTSAIFLTGGEDINSVKYYEGADCNGSVIGSGSNLSNISLNFSLLNQVRDIRAILSDDLGNETGCLDTGLDFEHDSIAPSITLVSPSNGVESGFPLSFYLKGTLSDNSTLKPNNITLDIYKDSNDCSQNNISSQAQNDFTGALGVLTLASNLVNNKYFASVTDFAGNNACVLLYDYTHTLGPLSALHSSWVVEKTIVSPNVPENNTISFIAKDVNMNPLSGLNIEVTLKDLKNLNPASDLDLTLNPSPTIQGRYDGVTNLTYSYSVNIKNGVLPTLTNRFIDNVYATIYPLCYTGVLESATAYNAVGNGDSNSPYEICHAEQLKSIQDNCNSQQQDACNKNYILKNEIDLAEYYAKGSALSQEFILASDPLHPFSGVFDGNNLKINNFRYTLDNNNFKGMFGYLDSAIIKNLEYSYEIINSSITQVGGLALSLNGNNVELSNLDISGNMLVSDSAIIGGVVKDINVANGSILNNSINITVQGMTSGGLFSSTLNGLNINNKIEIKENKIEGSINNLVQTSITDIGGFVGEGSNLEFDNNIHAVDMNLRSDVGMSNVGGVAGTLTNSSIDHSYITGEIIDSDDGFNNLGGMVAFIDNTNIQNSFSLIDINIPDCRNKCGKMIGDTINTLGTFFSELYASSESTFNLGSGGSLNFSTQEVEINTAFQPNYFTDQLNPPLDNFDFVNIWQENLNVSLPTLR